MFFCFFLWVFGCIATEVAESLIIMTIYGQFLTSALPELKSWFIHLCALKSSETWPHIWWKIHIRMIQNCQICKKVTVNTSENSFRLSHVPSFFHWLKTGSLINKWIDSLPSYRVLADPQNIICFPTAVLLFLLSKIPELRWSCNCRNMAIKKMPHRDGSVTVDKKLQAEKEIGSIYLYPKKKSV